MKSLFNAINKWFTEDFKLELDRLFSTVKVSVEWQDYWAGDSGFFNVTMSSGQGSTDFVVRFDANKVYCIVNEETTCITYWVDGEFNDVTSDIDDCSDIVAFIEERSKHLECFDSEESHA